MADTQKIATLRQGLQRPIRPYPDRIERGRKNYPLTGVKAEVSATRVITISGPDFTWVQRSDPLFEGQARRFVAKVNSAVAKASGGSDSRVVP